MSNEYKYQNKVLVNKIGNRHHVIFNDLNQAMKYITEKVDLAIENCPHTHQVKVEILPNPQHDDHNNLRLQYSTRLEKI
jgi:Rps23 Pro-64 3,4-dihydroxylase Tpa1-like proline 4-hydroxylase